jgi:flagellar protein FliS
MRYFETSVTTSSPLRLVVMLYEGAIRFSQQAIQDMEKKDLVGKRKSVDRALAILQQLRGSLDKQHGQIANDLDRLYDYMMSRIAEGSRKLDTRPIDECVRLLKTMAEAWERVAEEELRKSATANIDAAKPAGGRLQING